MKNALTRVEAELRSINWTRVQMPDLVGNSVRFVDELDDVSDKLRALGISEHFIRTDLTTGTIERLCVNPKATIQLEAGSGKTYLWSSPNYAQALGRSRRAYWAELQKRFNRGKKGVRQIKRKQRRAMR
jgi:hypothetical protein